MSKRSLDLITPTAEEDAAIAAGIAADPDTYELSEEEIMNMRLMLGFLSIGDQDVPQLNNSFNKIN